MPKYFRARKSNEVKDFLLANGFVLASRVGDDDVYEKIGYSYTVKIPNRNEVIPDGTMSAVRKYIEKCGINRKEVLRWWKENGYGE